MNNKKGNMVTCQAGGRKITRNSMWFRKLVTNDRRVEDRESNDDDNFSISDDERRDDERGDGDNVNPPVRDQQTPRRTTRRPVKLRDYITV